METMSQIIHRVWGYKKWKELPIDYKIKLRYNYLRTIKSRERRQYGIVDTKQQAKKHK